MSHSKQPQISHLLSNAGLEFIKMVQKIPQTSSELLRVRNGELMVPSKEGN